MSASAHLRWILMATDIREDASGFHRIVYKVDEGNGSMCGVTVNISQDALRKMQSQLARARFRPVERAQLLKKWALFEIAIRHEDSARLPSTITITARDIDDLGAYASDLGRRIQANAI